MSSQYTTELNQATCEEDVGFNRSRVCCPYMGVFHCFRETSYNEGMMTATGCLIQA